MAFVFAIYLMLKGFSRIWSVSMAMAVGVGVVVGVLVLVLFKQVMARRAHLMANSKEGVNELFTVPLIFAAALLSFAHGSNDVANAVGPLAAIVEVVSSGTGEIARAAPVPFWVMVVGAIGIAVGLWLFGPRVIRTVGSEITELDKMSTTHVAVGAVFGVGFLREYLKSSYARILEDIKAHHPEGDQAAIGVFLAKFSKASIDQKGVMLGDLKAKAKQQLDPAHFSKTERKNLRNVYRQELVKRSQVLRIVAAWVITVPASALMSAVLFFAIKGMLID